MRLRSSALALAVACGLAALPLAARAQNWGDIIGGLIDGAIRNNALKSWQKIEPEVIGCLQQYYSIDANQLVQNGITAQDSRVTPYIENCRRAIAEVRARQEEAERQRLALLAAQEQARKDAELRAHNDELLRLIEQGKRADEERRLRADAEAKDKAARDTREKTLVAKFGAGTTQDILAHKVRVGMTAAALVEARGNPGRKDVIPPDDEMWIYGGERIVLHHGKVSYIGH